MCFKQKVSLPIAPPSRAYVSLPRPSLAESNREMTGILEIRRACEGISRLKLQLHSVSRLCDYVKKYCRDPLLGASRISLFWRKQVFGC